MDYDFREHMPLEEVTTYWRENHIAPDESWHALINKRVPEVFHDMYMRRCPEGWLSWNDLGPEFPYDEADVPDADAWDEELADFYETLRDIDVYSIEGRNGPPMFGSGFLTKDVKDGIPGYRDYEAGISQAYDARIRAQSRVAPVLQPKFRQEHGVGDFLVGLDLTRKNMTPAKAQPQPAQRTIEQQEDLERSVAVTAAKRANGRTVDDMPEVPGESVIEQEDDFGGR